MTDPEHQRELVLRTLRETTHITSVRTWEALMLARTPEAWAQLLKGRPVPLDQLDPQHLARMRKRRAA